MKEKTVKELELEFKQLKEISRRVEASIARSKTRSFAETEMLRELLPCIKMQIDYNLRRTEEMRLQSSIKVSEKAERTISRLLQKISAGIDSENRSGFSLIHAWTDSLRRNRESRHNEQQAILNSICNSASTYREILENLSLQNNRALTQYLPILPLPIPPATDESRSKKEHKGRPPSRWTKALDDCIELQGGDVGYKTAAEWIGFRHPSATKQFFAKLDIEPTAGDKTALLNLLKSDKAARDLFHKQLNAAKQRFSRNRKQN